MARVVTSAVTRVSGAAKAAGIDPAAFVVRHLLFEEKDAVVVEIANSLKRAVSKVAEKISAADSIALSGVDKVDAAMVAEVLNSMVKMAHRDAIMKAKGWAMPEKEKTSEEPIIEL